jgi:hypothetical protein
MENCEDINNDNFIGKGEQELLSWSELYQGVEPRLPPGCAYYTEDVSRCLYAGDSQKCLNPDGTDGEVRSGDICHACPVGVQDGSDVICENIDNTHYRDVITGDDCSYYQNSNIEFCETRYTNCLNANFDSFADVPDEGWVGRRYAYEVCNTCNQTYTPPVTTSTPPVTTSTPVTTSAPVTTTVPVTTNSPIPSITQPPATQSTPTPIPTKTFFDLIYSNGKIGTLGYVLIFINLLFIVGFVVVR